MLVQISILQASSGFLMRITLVLAFYICQLGHETVVRLNPAVCLASRRSNTLRQVKDFVRIDLRLDMLQPGKVSTPVQILCRRLVQVGSRVVEIHADLSRLHRLRQAGHESVDEREPILRICLVHVDGVVELVHQELVSMRVRRRIHRFVGDCRGLAAVEVDLNVPVALECLGRAEPVLCKRRDLVVCELV
jgi:hypothetical protein